MRPGCLELRDVAMILQMGEGVARGGGDAVRGVSHCGS